MDVKELFLSNVYINKLDIIKEILDSLHFGKIILGEEGSGKSTLMSLLSMLYTGEEFSVPGWDELKASVNDDIYVINISFSDIKPGTYEDVINQISELLIKLYLQHIDLILSEKHIYRDEEYFIDILERKCDKPEFGLGNLVHLVNYETDKSPLLLVDEPYKPLYATEEQDSDQIKNFLRDFYRFTDIDGFCKMIFFSSYSERYYWHSFIYNCYNTDIYSSKMNSLFFLNKHELCDFLKKQGVDIAKLDFINLLSEEQKKFRESKRRFNENDYHYKFDTAEKNFTDEDYIYSFRFAYSLAGLEFKECSETVTDITVSDLDIKLNEKRQSVIKRKKEKELQEKLWHEQSLRNYAKPFLIKSEFPSEFIGIRKCSDFSDTKEIIELTEKLKELYRLYLNCNKKNESVYHHMQGFDRDKKTDWEYEDEELKNKLILKYGFDEDKRELSVNSGNAWCQIRYSKDTDAKKTDLYSMVKVYASVRDGKVKDLFLGAVEYLILNGEIHFYSKVSEYMRNDSMCFWVSRKGFFLLEKYFSEKDIVKSLPFTPYRGNLGISREIHAGWSSSYNSCITELFELYFRRINNETELNLQDMYQYLIDMWNGEYGIEYSDPYAKDDAQLLVVLLESMAVITGRTEIDDNNFLLSEDSLWGTLCECRCWAELEDRINRTSE